MKDYWKTKDELIEEIETMHRHSAELEKKITQLESHTDKKPVNRQPRKEIDAAVEFIADFDIIEARGVNISEGGICFELKEDLPFEMQFRHNGKMHRHRAHLIWVKRLPEGGYRFGLKFVPPEERPEF
jgi:hypothetical protein